MKTLSLFAMLFLLSAASLGGAALTIDVLLSDPPTEGSVVTVRGFLYKLDEDQWVMAREPNLRTCCIGSVEKSTEQILVAGRLHDVAEARTHTVSGRYTQQDGRHLIQEAEMAGEAEKRPFTALAATLLSVFLLTGYLIYRRRVH